MSVFEIQRYILLVFGVFLLCRNDYHRIIIVNFCATPWTARIFSAISQLALSLALRAKIRIAPLAMQDLAKVSSATPGAAIVVLSHSSILPMLIINIAPSAFFIFSTQPPDIPLQIITNHYTAADSCRNRITDIIRWRQPSFSLSLQILFLSAALYGLRQKSARVRSAASRPCAFPAPPVYNGRQKQKNPAGRRQGEVIKGL